MRLSDGADYLRNLDLSGMSPETALQLKEDLSRGRRALLAIEAMVDEVLAPTQ